MNDVRPDQLPRCTGRGCNLLAVYTATVDLWFYQDELIEITRPVCWQHMKGDDE